MLSVAPDSVDSGLLLGFPVLVTLTSAQQFILSGAKPDGSDIMITKADGVTPLPREIVTFDPASNEAEIWFRADTLSASHNEFFLYYGNPGASQPAADGSVWNESYVAVYHFSDDPGIGVLTDFGSRGNHAAAGYQSTWTSSNVTEGIIGQAWDFDGTHHIISSSGVSTQDSSFVISSWAMLTTRLTDFAFHANPGYWHVSFQINDVHARPHYNIANPWRDLRWDPNPLPLDGQFHLYTWVFDGVGDTILFFFDGMQQPATPHAIDPGVEHFYTGHPINPAGDALVGIAGPMYLNSLDPLNGPADEFRVVEGTLSAPWLLTEYRNQRSPQGFLGFGPEESAGPVPVHLLGFFAEREGPSVRVEWRVSRDGSPDPEFRLFRETTSGRQDPVVGEMYRDGFSYSLTDETAPSDPFLYRLAERTRAGEMLWLGQAEVAGVGAPALGLVIPNPLRAASTIRFSIARAGHVRVQAFDVSGREAERIMDGQFSAGEHEVKWDQDNAGPRLVPGIYFIRLETLEGSLTRKVILLH